MRQIRFSSPPNMVEELNKLAVKKFRRTRSKVLRGPASEDANQSEVDATDTASILYALFESAEL